MDAKEARAITSANLKGPVIEPFVFALNREIRRVAAKGESRILPWGYIATLRGLSPTKDQQEAIKLHFMNQGFKWEDHPDPDPGHPCSYAYSTISW